MTIPSITANELEQLRRSGKTVELIDVRTPVEYREVHVAFARNVPLERLDPAAVMQARNGTHGELLYVICRSGSRGHQACMKFVAAGFTNIVNVDGGTLACVNAGLPVIRGKKCISLDRQVRIVIGLLVIVGTLLAWLVDPIFLGLVAAVGAGVLYAGLTDVCFMAMLIARMPWNQLKEPATVCCPQPCLSPGTSTENLS